MDRRGFLLGATALLASGCARVAPTTQNSVEPAPIPSPLAVGAAGGPDAAMLAGLLAQAVTATERAANVTTAAEDWQAALGDGTLACLPAYAGTLWAELSDADEPPVDSEVVADLADLVAPEISVLAAPNLDGGLVWMVTQNTAKAGITRLDQLGPWSKGRTAAVPALAVSRADGLPGLRAVYHAAFTTGRVDDPRERAAALVAGRAQIAAFRRTDYTGVSGLVALDDPDQLGAPDPVVVLVNSALADDDPDAVLAMDAVAKALTLEALLGLQAKVATGAQPAAVAQEWLAAKGLAQ